MKTFLTAMSRAGLSLAFGLLLAGCGSDSPDTEQPDAPLKATVDTPIQPTSAPATLSVPATPVAAVEAPVLVEAPSHADVGQPPLFPPSPHTGDNRFPETNGDNGAFEHQTRERLNRLESERLRSERQEQQRQEFDRRQAQQQQAQERIEAQRRTSEVEASQRRIDGWEREKEDIAKSRGNHSFKQFRMETRDMRIKDEQRRMNESLSR